MNQQLKILSICLFFAANFTKAQTGKLEVGIEGGPSITNLRGPKSTYAYEPIVLSAAGFSFRYHFSKLISLRTGLNYEAKGYTSTIKHEPWYIDTTYQVGFSARFDYLTLPLTVRLTFGEKIKCFFHAGAYMGILLQKHDKTTGDQSDFDPYYLKDEATNYRNFDFGLSGGLGIGIPLKEQWTVSLEARGNYGLTDIRKRSSGLYHNEGLASTYSTSLLLGISYWITPPDSKDSRSKHDNRYELGIEGGANISPFIENKPYRNNDLSYSTIQIRYGNSIGLSFQWNTRKRLSLRTGILFQQNNYSFKTSYSDAGTGIVGSGKGSHQYEYLTLPILARFSFGQKAHFFFNTGLFVGVSTKQRESVEGTMYYPYAGGTATEYKSTSNSIPDFQPIDFGLVGGLGIEVPIKKKWNVSLEIRDNFGVINAINQNNYSRTVRTHALNLLFGVSYKLGFREAK